MSGGTGHRSLMPAIVVAMGVLGTMVVVAPLDERAESESHSPVFPREVAPYSWWTPQLSASDVEGAIMTYQNGVGVEFLDFPQAVLVGTDGQSYRRLGAAESRAIGEDQGDPAQSVLSADGSFVVIGGAGQQGNVEVVTLRDNSRRTVDIGHRVSSVPLSISADGTSVLLLTSDGRMSPLLDMNFQLHGTLALLDLETGALEKYPDLADVSTAALSPDGTRIVANAADGVVVMDVADGSTVPTSSRGVGVYLEGDAWSPDGERFAYLDGKSLVVVDVGPDLAANVQPPQPVVTVLPLTDTAYGTAIGWRNNSTALATVDDGSGENKSRFVWVDIETGAEKEFSSYTPNFTSAALGGADVARNLVSTWSVDPTTVNRESRQEPQLALALAGLVVFATWAVTPRYSFLATERRKSPKPS